MPHTPRLHALTLSPHTIRAGVLASVIGISAIASAGDYIADDGSGGFNIGPSTFDANTTWLNGFTADPGCSWLTNLRVSFSSGLGEGRDVTLVVFDDPVGLGDPTDAVPIAITRGLTQQTGPQGFATYPIRPVRVSGSFFIAAIMDLEQGQSAARMDQDTLGERSWLFYNPEFNLYLGTSPFILQMSTSPFSGTWMLRASAEATGCEADLNRDGVVDFFDVQRFLTAFQLGGGEADFAQPIGEVDFFDVQAFLNAFQAGCP